MNDQPRSIAPSSSRSLADHALTPNPRVTRGLTRVQELFSVSRARVGMIRSVLGNFEPDTLPDWFEPDMSTDESYIPWVFPPWDSLEWFLADDIAFHGDGKSVMCFPRVWSLSGVVKNYNRRIEFGDKLDTVTRQVGIGNGWIISGDYDIWWCNSLLSEPVSKVVDLHEHLPIGSRPRCLGRLDDGVIAFCDSGAYVIVDSNRGVHFGRASFDYRHTAQAGDLVYAVPHDNSCVLHVYTIQELRHGALHGAAAVVPHAEHHISGSVRDLAGAGDLLFTIESTYVSEWQQFDASYLYLDFFPERVDDAVYRIAAYRAGGLIGSFKPEVNGIEVVPRRLDATQTCIAVAVEPNKGGIVLYANGSASDWLELPPMPWRDPTDDAFATVCDLWDEIRRAVGRQTDRQSRKYEALLRECNPIQVGGLELRIACPYPFHVKMLQEPGPRTAVRLAVGDVTGLPLMPRFVITNGA